MCEFIKAREAEETPGEMGEGFKKHLERKKWLLKFLCVFERQSLFGHQQAHPLRSGRPWGHSSSLRLLLNESLLVVNKPRPGPRTPVFYFSALPDSAVHFAHKELNHGPVSPG